MRYKSEKWPLQAALKKNKEGTQEEEEANPNPKETSVHAAVAAVLWQPDGIFALKE